MGRVRIFLVMIVISIPSYAITADEPEVMRAKEQLVPPGVLPAWQTQAERSESLRNIAHIPEITMIDDGLLPPPPAPPYRVPAEFEPVSAFIVSHADWEKNPMLFSMIKGGSQEHGARAIVLTKTAPEDYAMSLEDKGVDLSRVTLVQPTLGVDSKWTRDYAPISIYESELDSAGPLGFIDLHYSSQRTKDDAVTEFLTDTIGINRYGLEGSDQLPPDSYTLFMEGGNYQTDGMGTCILSNDIPTDNGTNPDANTLGKVEPILAAYLGCDQVIWLTPVPNSGTGHVDMYSKLLTPTDILMIDFPNQNGNNAAADKVQESNVEIMENATNLNGESFTVHRVTIPSLGSGFFGWIYRTYTNSVMLNNVVLVPTYNAPKYDPLALEVYREILGDSYEVIGIPSGSIVAQGGAVHCTTMQIPSSCGNGNWEPLLEDCDGDDLGDQTCEDLELGPGELLCAENCEFDTAGCSELDTESEPDTESETETNVDTDSDTETNSETETDLDTDTQEAEDSETETDSDTGSKGGIDTDTNFDTGEREAVDTGDSGELDSDLEAEEDAGDDIYGDDSGGCGCHQAGNRQRQPLLQMLFGLLAPTRL